MVDTRPASKHGMLHWTQISPPLSHTSTWKIRLALNHLTDAVRSMDADIPACLPAGEVVMQSFFVGKRSLA